MAKLVSTNQRIITGVTYPAAAYSRALSLEFSASAGIGNSSFQYSNVVGENVWLLGVDVYAHGSVAAEMIGGLVYLGAGTAIPAAAGVIATQWELLVVNKGLKPGMALTAWEEGHWRFDMRRYFGGAARRFGVAVENFSATSQFKGIVILQISEG